MAEFMQSLNQLTWPAAILVGCALAIAWALFIQALNQLTWPAAVALVGCALAIAWALS